MIGNPHDRGSIGALIGEQFALPLVAFRLQSADQGVVATLLQFAFDATRGSQRNETPFVIFQTAGNAPIFVELTCSLCAGVQRVFLFGMKDHLVKQLVKQFEEMLLIEHSLVLRVCVLLLTILHNNVKTHITDGSHAFYMMILGNTIAVSCNESINQEDTNRE